MSRSKLVPLALLLLLAGVVVVLALRNRQAPLLPEGEEHAFVSRDHCLTCHGPDGAMPRGVNHPVDRDCLRCHGRR